MNTRCCKLAMALIGCAVCIGAQGETVYRCGSLYTQTPCAGAIAVDASDERSAAQKQQADDGAVKLARAAALLEKERLAGEKMQSQRTTEKTRHGKPARNTASVDAPRPHAKAKKKEPDYFTASSRPEKTEKKVQGKTGSKNGTPIADH